MGEAHRHPELLVILSAQLYSHPLAVAGGAPTQIHRYIKNRAHTAAH